MARLATIVLNLLPLATAHFTIRAPSPLGNDDANQNDSPCGGYTPNLDVTVGIHAGGEAFSVQTAHPQSNWLIRATLDANAAGDWVQLYPIFQQSGIGTFCIPSVTVPAGLVGQKGIVGLIANGADGMLYGCIAANFVNGTGDSIVGCTNSSAVSLSFNDDVDLIALLDTPSSTNSQKDDVNAASERVASRAGVFGPAALAIGVIFGL